MDEVRPEAADNGGPTPEPGRDRLGFLAAVARGQTVTDAAREYGIPRRTADRWASSPKGKAYVSRLRALMFAQACGALARHATRAAEKLAELLDSESAQVALQAARSLLSSGLDLRKSVDYEERLAALEAKLGGESPP